MSGVTKRGILLAKWSRRIPYNCNGTWVQVQVLIVTHNHTGHSEMCDS